MFNLNLSLWFILRNVWGKRFMNFWIWIWQIAIFLETIEYTVIWNGQRRYLVNLCGNRFMIIWIWIWLIAIFWETSKRQVYKILNFNLSNCYILEIFWEHSFMKFWNWIWPIGIFWETSEEIGMWKFEFGQYIANGQIRIQQFIYLCVEKIHKI